VAPHLPKRLSTTAHTFIGPAKKGSLTTGHLLQILFLHGAIRTTLSGPEDYENDDNAGFQRIEAREIDTIGTEGIVKKIRDTVGNGPVYLSIDASPHSSRIQVVGNWPVGHHVDF